jgi:type VI secretion system FHA domain protein
VRPVRIRVEHREAGTATEHEFHSSPIRVGRNPLNDLSLPYPFVSGWHAVIRFDDRVARFFDLGSTNGTLKDGRRVAVGESVAFDDPVSVQLGDLDLVMSRDREQTHVPRPQEPARPKTWMRAPLEDEARVGEIDTDYATQPGLPPLDAKTTARVPMQQIHEALAALRPYHDQLHQARLQFEQQLRARIVQLPPHVREQAEVFIRREFPSGQPERPRSTPPTGAPASATGPGNVAALAEQLLPQLPPPASTAEVERFLACVRDVLETCAKGLVELQNGQEQFGREMGVKAIKEFTPLHVAASARDVLDYLLDYRHGGPHRMQELVGVFADIMIHQVALLNGIAEGGRALLAQIDPDEIERQLGRGWGKKVQQKWDRFVTRHKELTAEDRMLTEILFGPEFARAYAEVGGEQVPREGGDGST